MERWNWNLGERPTWELLSSCCSLCMAAHQSPSVPFLLEWLPPPGSSSPPPSPAYAVFAFRGSWSVDDWFSEQVPSPFGSSKVDGDLFPSLRTIVDSVPAVVNAGFLGCFRRVLEGSALQAEVNRALNWKRQIVFTGHSSGGAISALAAIWLLESLKSKRDNQFFPLCVTFGSPLVGDNAFSYSLQREGWSSYFLHFVMPFDIVPRIFLAPLQSIKKDFQPILHMLCAKSSFFSYNSVGNSHLITFFATILRNSQSVVTKRACTLMRCTNPLLETLTSFTKFSPYRPFGAYVFCTSDTSLLMVKNSEAVLQLLFYFLQLGHEQEAVEVAYRSLKEHLVYEAEMQKNLQVPDIVYLNNLEAVPLSLCDAIGVEMELIGTLFRDLGLNAEARLSLRAAGEQEKQRQKNQDTVDANLCKMREAVSCLTEYQERCKIRGLGYYDTFKLQKNLDDFNANVRRIELTGLWDQIVQMVRKYELPGNFESREDWVKVGTSYRRLVEPLDIANYYMHAKNEDTGPYLLKGRPTRYKYTQEWFEFTHRMAMGSSSESFFWAKVEELCIDTNDGKPYLEMKKRIIELEKEAEVGHSNGLLSDVFLGESTFVKWWKTLPEQHRLESSIGKYLTLGHNNSLS